VPRSREADEWDSSDRLVQSGADVAPRRFRAQYTHAGTSRIGLAARHRPGMNNAPKRENEQ